MIPHVVVKEGKCLCSHSLVDYAFPFKENPHLQFRSHDIHEVHEGKLFRNQFFLLFFFSSLTRVRIRIVSLNSEHVSGRIKAETMVVIATQSGSYIQAIGYQLMFRNTVTSFTLLPITLKIEA